MTTSAGASVSRNEPHSKFVFVCNPAVDLAIISLWTPKIQTRQSFSNTLRWWMRENSRQCRVRVWANSVMDTDEFVHRNSWNFATLQIIIDVVNARLHMVQANVDAWDLFGVTHHQNRWPNSTWAHHIPTPNVPTSSIVFIFVHFQFPAECICHAFWKSFFVATEMVFSPVLI